MLLDLLCFLFFFAFRGKLSLPGGSDSELAPGVLVGQLVVS